MTHPIVKCVICKEDTTHNTESSMYGSVHRYGPTDHAFVPDTFTHDTIAYRPVMEFGTMRRRIVNCNDATRAFERITGRKTLTDTDLRFLPHLGTRLVNVDLQETQSPRNNS
jgi:hypothetical protein